MVACPGCQGRMPLLFRRHQGLPGLRGRIRRVEKCGASVMDDDNKTHDDLVSDWQENAKKHDDENYWFLRSLKQRSSKKVERIALELHQEAFSTVDCTKCANCCRTLRVVVTDDDIPRIAGHLGMAPDEFITAYLERNEEEGCYRIK